jgi:hypothetical protein
MPGSAVAIEYTVTIASTVSDFDEAAQDMYKSNLATLLGQGVQPHDITLTIAPASVRVTATIAAPSPANADLLKAVLTTQTPATLSTVTGLTVETIAPIPAYIIVALSPRPPPSPPLAPPPRAGGGLTTGQVVGIAVGVSVAGLLVILALILWKARDLSKQVAKTPNTVIIKQTTRGPTIEKVEVISATSSGMVEEKV